MDAYIFHITNKFNKSLFLKRSRMSSWFRCTRYNIMWSSLSVTYDRSIHCFIRANWPPRYNSNIVESGVKHHNQKYVLMSWLNLSSASSLTRFALKFVKFSVMKISSGSPFRRLLALYNLSRILTVLLRAHNNLWFSIANFTVDMRSTDIFFLKFKIKLLIT